MKRSLLNGIITAALVAASQTGSASDVTIPNSFTANTPAVAAQVNANFAAVEAAVDDNYARILVLQSNPSLTGNLTLVPSTSATTGVIMKGAVPFLHDYGSANTFLGENAGNFTMTGVGFNTAIGRYALRANTTGGGNTASGASALWNNTTGGNNTASGVAALEQNTTGVSNTASGHAALQFNTTGSSNTASGASALRSNTTGTTNTASGANALYSNTTGNTNTASGASALYSNTTGVGNTASGGGALQNITSGSGNTAIGFSAGSNLTTGSNNIVIGNQYSGVAGESNTIRIGDIQTRAFIAGISGVGVTGSAVYVSTAGQLGILSSSRRVKDDIADMGKASQVLMQLRPVTFHYKSDQNPQGRSLQYGLIAEEVAKVAPQLVAHSADGQIETVYYQHLTPMLLNEYQTQQRTIERQAKELAELKQQMARMTAVLSRLQQAERVAAADRP